jgi:ribosomal protein L29
MTTQPSELRELHDDELETRLREAKEELFNLRFQMATGQLDNNRRLRTDPARAGTGPVGGTRRAGGIGMSEHRSERQRARSGVPAKSRSDFVGCRCGAMPAMSACAKSKGTSA